MGIVYVKIKDEKHAKKVIKMLVRIGYEQYASVLRLPLDHVKTIAVYDDGDYQLLNRDDNSAIKPKDVMNSKPVKYFLEYKHV